MANLHIYLVYWILAADGLLFFHLPASAMQASNWLLTAARVIYPNHASTATTDNLQCPQFCLQSPRTWRKSSQLNYASTSFILSVFQSFTWHAGRATVKSLAWGLSGMTRPLRSIWDTLCTTAWVTLGGWGWMDFWFCVRGGTSVQHMDYSSMFWHQSQTQANLSHLHSFLPSPA